MPGATLAALKVVAGAPVLTVARSLSPDREPARIVNDVAAQPVVGADHVSVSDWPLTTAASALGALGADPHGSPMPRPVNVISFEGPLTPALFTARMRTK